MKKLDQRQQQVADLLTQHPGPYRIHFIAIGGTGMAPLACLLAELGHTVVGSDLPLYPPMSDLLDSVGIEPLVGFDAAHLEGNPRPDLVVVGNAVPRSNEEVQAAEALGLPRISMPEAVGHFLLEGRKSLVATGTHGKTTTSAMAAWVYEQCGGNPGYLIGGAPIGLDSSFRLAQGRRFVVEGDEYNAAYFDRGPKFLHYRPNTVTLTSVEYDHVDLYPSAESFRGAFEQLMEEVPPDGLVVACIDTADVRDVVSKTKARVIGYSAKAQPERLPGFDLPVLRPVREPVADSQGTVFEVEHGGELFEVRLKLWGQHNVANALAVWGAAVADGYSGNDVAAALSSFAGVKRRLEVRGAVDGVTVIDDFAHHPTEVAASLSALHSRYPDRRLIALFEPRSLSAGREAFADAYVQAFEPAQAVLIAPVFHAERLGDEERLDLDRLCRRLQGNGIEATAWSDYDSLIGHAVSECEDGDVLVTMSSGAFGGAPARLLELLGSKA